MSFDPSVITEVFPPARHGSRLTLEWTTAAPDGTFFQVYLQGRLAWWGAQLVADVPSPSGLVDVQIGAVGAGEQSTDFSSSLTPIATRALLAWSGFGATAYRVYEGAAGFGLGGFGFGGMGGTAATLVGTVPAIEGGYSTDGFGLAGFGQGGFGNQGGSFSWTSGPLSRGAWNFSVVPIDAAGNAGTPALSTVTITAPPRPPAPDTSGHRLAYTYDFGLKKVTLTWLASPG